MVILQAVAVLLTLLVIYDKSKIMIRSLANTWIILTAFIWLVTEITSIFRIFTKTGILITWVFYIVGLLVILYRKNPKRVWKECIVDNTAIKRLWKEQRVQIIVFFLFALFVLIGSGLRSLNNTDSSVYHLPRVMHWIQNRSVWPYATNNDLQIRYPALSEYFVAQIFLAGLPDRLASLPQAAAFLGSGGMIYGICRRMKVSRVISWLSSFIYYCAPMALAQSFTTQTDDVAGMFLLVYIYFILDFIQSEELAGGMGMIREGVRLAACVMFGYLCKPTICFVMVVFFIWMCIVRIKKRDRFSLLAGYVIVGMVTAIVLYIPLMAKTYEIYSAKNIDSVADGMNDAVSESDITATENLDNSQQIVNILAPDSYNVARGLENPKHFLMTALMNYCRNCSSSVFPKWNIVLNKIVNTVGGVLNYDVSGFALQEGEGFFHHDTASNPVILIGIVVMCIALVMRRCQLNGQQKIYILSAVLGFVIQCGLMAFTLYRGRYLVGSMAVLCPAFAITVDTLEMKHNIKVNLITVIMVLTSIGAVNVWSYEILHMRDGFTGKDVHQYLIDNTWLENEFASLFDYINVNGYKTVGLYGGFTYEYLVWQEIENLERLETVDIRHPEYQKYEDQTFYPECIIRDETDSPEETVECHGKKYMLVWHVPAYLSQFAVYVPEETILQ